MTYRVSFIIIVISVFIKLLAIYYTEFSLFGDEAQYWLWSKSPELGYYSKPPLLAWLINFYTFVFGSSFVILKCFPLFFYFFTTYVIYLLSYELYENKKLAALTAASFYLLPSVSVSSFLISTDVVLIPLCSLTLLILLKIRKDPKIINFVYLGVFLGLSFLTKYAALYYIISIILIFAFDNKLRSFLFLKFFNLLLFVFCFFIVLLPNIFWNFKNSWITFYHTSDNAGLTRADINITQGLEFLLSQTVMMGPILFIFFLFNIKKITLSFQTKFLLTFSLPVFFIIFIESVLVRANANWAAVGIVPLFLLITNIVYNYSKKAFFYNNIFNFVFCLILFFLIATSSNLKIFDRINGVSKFALTLESKHLNKNNLLIVEDRLLYSSLSYYLKEKNKIILTPHNPKNKIKSHFHLSSPLKPNHEKDFIFIGNPESLNYLKKNFQIIKRNKVSVKFVNSPIEIYEIIF